MTKIPSVEERVEELLKQDYIVFSPDGGMGINTPRLRTLLIQALTSEREAGEARLKTFAEDIIEVDKTERYEYSKNDCDRNAKGELAGSGARWATPKEMAQRVLQTLIK